jgi:hypothetical protein
VRGSSRCSRTARCARAALAAWPRGTADAVAAHCDSRQTRRAALTRLFDYYVATCAAAKLDAHSRTEAVTSARSLGLLAPSASAERT